MIYLGTTTVKKGNTTPEHGLALEAGARRLVRRARQEGERFRAL